MQPTDWETDIVLIVSYSTDAGAMISPLRFGMEDPSLPDQGLYFLACSHTHVRQIFIES